MNRLTEGFWMMKPNPSRKPVSEVNPKNAPTASYIQPTKKASIQNHLGLCCKCLSYPESCPLVPRFASGGADKQVIIWTHKVGDWLSSLVIRKGMGLHP